MKKFFVINFFLINLLIMIFFLDNVFVALTFIVHFSLITIGIIKSIKGKYVTVDLIIWLFKYLFFIFSPIIQINTGYFPNNLPVIFDEVIIVNFILILWSSIFLLVRKTPRQVTMNKFELNKSIESTKPTTFFFFVSATVIGLFTYLLLGFDFFLGHIGWEDIIENSSLSLIAAIGLRGIIFTNFLLVFAKFKNNRGIYLIPFLISVLLLIYYVNPFNVARYYLAFVGLTIIALFYRELITTLRFFIIFLVGVFIVFPFVNIFRDGFSEITSFNISELAFSQLLQLHFDAYSNIIATFQYVSLYGLQWGFQLLGSVFFFVPRNIWESKPPHTGELIGDYLIQSGYMNFNNLANALPSEMFVDFGILGIVVVPALMAYLLNKLDQKLNVKNYLAYCIILGFIFYIYRGALMSGFAYSIGTLVIVYLLPKFIDKIVTFVKSSTTEQGDGNIGSYFPNENRRL
ncbi:O-antigen polymerase [Shouchella lehensis]|uniref:Oligosaccharide repeat unit polymerase n=1 Tax=Shouchella lehensis TaxID=300825 RepID=A0A4Y7WF86_9BACI|nr:O-antigen polymerase [Shouchella lehensis]MBG9785021.1 hypothetical protein [Shouchella lehensis]TES46444.1 oligosaccharide repeat unit polymerase [Shouchella lehensis]